MMATDNIVCSACQPRSSQQTVQAAAGVSNMYDAPVAREK